ncbi:MAG: response regulator [Elusimicrobiota bacterium]|nr:response regulator [Elusimicrobiota bacterium]
MKKKLPLIIITDDCWRYLALLKRVLSENLHAEILATTNAAEAVAWALNEPPLLFITDIVHDGLDGIEALRMLKGSKRTEGVAVWVISGSVPGIFQQESLEALGADFVAAKPCDPGILVEKARGLCRGRPVKTGAARWKPGDAGLN